METLNRNGIQRKFPIFPFKHFLFLTISIFGGKWPDEKQYKITKRAKSFLPIYQILLQKLDGDIWNSCGTEASPKNSVAYSISAKGTHTL